MTDEEKKAVSTLQFRFEVAKRNGWAEEITLKTVINLILKQEEKIREEEETNRELLNSIEKQENIIKNACYIIKKTNKQFKDFDDIKLNEYLYNFDKCATIKEE